MSSLPWLYKLPRTALKCLWDVNLRSDASSEIDIIAVVRNNMFPHANIFLQTSAALSIGVFTR